MRIKPAQSIVEVIMNNPEIFNAFNDFSKKKKKKLVISHTEITIKSPSKVDVRV